MQWFMGFYQEIVLETMTILGFFWVLPLQKLKRYLACIIYGECSKISNTFLLLFSNKMLAIGAEIHKMFVRTANREDPDQTASKLGLHCLSRTF